LEYRNIYNRYACARSSHEQKCITLAEEKLNQAYLVDPFCPTEIDIPIDDRWNELSIPALYSDFLFSSYNQNAAQGLKYPFNSR
jgi:hypothetical protein